MSSTSDRPLPRFAAVPSSRPGRLLRLGGIAAGIAGGVVTDGLRQLAQGRRPGLPELLLAPAQAMRLASGLAGLRGAAMKLGQMLSLDPGLVLPREVAALLAQLQEAAPPMPPPQLERVLARAWGAGWRARFKSFEMRPFAAASIGQVHRAETLDGQRLAIKVQYPGVRASIDSDVENIAALLRLPGLLPREMDISPLLSAAKAQLHAEADYAAEAAQLRAFGDFLRDDPRFIVPAPVTALSTPEVLAMAFVDSRPIASLATAAPAQRDAAMTALIELTLRELFVFGAMQTDPNPGNFRVTPDGGRIVLLDFGAVRHIAPELQAAFRALLAAGLDADRAASRAAMQTIGYFDAATAPRHQDAIVEMFLRAMAPLRQRGPYDFARQDLLAELRDRGLALGLDRDLMHVPPADTLFLHRKIGGLYLLATQLRAKVDCAACVAPYRA
ncbi:ABC1 kinase family protein [Bradyrhizobium sp. HKCCYLRH3099]|uniref:ABC1 kinase family protein n=1 Tax=unclassified Bradyrhizobium TaxID=2631580 RepID=UPI003EBDD33A